MSRLLCPKCHRPLKTCICRFITHISNDIPVIILQHPNEVTQSKGSLTLLANSLSQCTVIIDEDFSQNEQLNQLLAHYKEQAYLLYPHKQAIALSFDKFNNSAKNQEDKIINNNNICLILIDATWKKAYRMFMLSTNLQQLPKLQLPDGYQSHYKIRKTSVINGLSTLEACCYALSLLEKNKKKYQPVIENFKEFNQFLLSFQKRD